MQKIELWQDERYDQLIEEDFDDPHVNSAVVASSGSLYERFMELTNKCSGLILGLTSKFCLIDVYNDQHKIKNDDDDEIRAVRPRWWAHWPKLIYLVNLYCILKLTVNIWLQYEYDHCQLKVKWLSKQNEETPEMRVNNHPLESYLNNLSSQCNSTRATLKSIGAPHLNASIAIECVYITIIMMNGSSYLLGHIFFRWVEKFDFYLVRAILNRKREMQNCRRLIIREVNNFIMSRRNFILFSLEIINSKKAHIMASSSSSTSEMKTTPANSHLKEAHKLWLSQQLIVKQFKLMAKSGALMPLNWTGSWLDRMSLVYCAFNCGCLVWDIVFNVGFYHLIPKYGNFQVESEPLDLLFDLDLAILSAILSIAVVFYLSTCVISCLDQARLIARLHQLVKACGQENWRIYFETIGTTSGSGLPLEDFRWQQQQQHKYAQMNANLLQAIVHYKVFVVQLRPVLRCVAFVSFISIAIILSHPVMIRLHIPYVDSSELKSRYYIISLIAAFFVNTNLIPVCYINSRCVNLYNALHSLLAHTIHLSELCLIQHQVALKSSSPPPTGSVATYFTLYDVHSIWALRRELKSSAMFVRKFETKAFGMTFTYANLLRVYFWLGAISLSILAPEDHSTMQSNDKQQQQQQHQRQRLGTNIFSDFLRDPFGFYSLPEF